MPHLILEHSAELATSHDLQALVDDLFETACAHPAISANPSAVKVRSNACQHLRSGVSPETFAHLELRLLPGRSSETKADLAGALLKALERHLPKVGSLSVEPVEMDAATYVKRTL
ncbi:5-carboxymethyl-2-hydroxymuconate isomerase [Shimia gijangensis]|uniref:5-carboxymethyl-2-hydroxymuconate isomerase n=1 Tax=Shimia gijangensis TaxID=1470563 RepID=A0A1M6JNH3_9RHOB|nr:hypothetical protein [Shimia gijangensis]SHJ48236.1 5-carboxymethyl-2-hydroxymuconate isomerase [Shimia gijangensis]